MYFYDDDSTRLVMSSSDTDDISRGDEQNQAYNIRRDANKRKRTYCHPDTNTCCLAVTTMDRQIEKATSTKNHSWSFAVGRGSIGQHPMTVLSNQLSKSDEMSRKR